MRNPTTIQWEKRLKAFNFKINGHATSMTITWLLNWSEYIEFFLKLEHCEEFIFCMNSERFLGKKSLVIKDRNLKSNRENDGSAITCELST